MASVSRVNVRKVSTYYGATFVLTLVLSLIYVRAGGTWTGPHSYAVMNGMMLIPGIAAIVVQKWLAKEPLTPTLALRWRPNRWFVFAWLVPPGIVLAALGVSLLAPGATFTPDMAGLPAEMASFKSQIASLGLPPLAGMLATGLALGPTVCAVGGLGEEVGWRGLLYKELMPLGFWRCSLLGGALWAGWHIPLVVEGYGDPHHRVADGLGLVAFAVLLTPLLNFVRMRSGSVAACGLFHGTLSSTRLISIAFVRGSGLWGTAAIPIVLLAAQLPLYLAWKRWDRVWRARVAHHEAAHAVVVAACGDGFKLGEVLLTHSATADGTLGGYTGWNNPAAPQRNPSADTVRLFGPQAITVLYAGQYAERELAKRDPAVRLPPREPNWDHDDSEAQLTLALKPLSDVPEAERELRTSAADHVARFWPAIEGVAAELTTPFREPEKQIVESRHPDGRVLVAASRVLSGTEVREMLDRALAQGSRSRSRSPV